MKQPKWFLSVLSFGMLVACGPTASEKCNEALTVGNLKEAETLLKEISDGGVRRYYGGMLIDEYLSMDKLDRAIYVFDRITGHCSMYDMQYKSAYASAEYTQTYSAKIYQALIKAERYDEAWTYHERNYDGENYPGNAPNYFSYMTDCITHMCNLGNAAQAIEFMKQKRIWFLNNVDNHEWGKDYPNYRYDIMSAQLNKILNDAQY